MATTNETSLRRRHSELTRDLILRTVAELLEEGDAAELAVPEVARRSGVSLRTVYRYFPSREQLIAAAGEWIGVNVVGGRIPTLLDEVPQVYAENAARWDEHPRLVEAMALSRGANSLRSIRRQERLARLRDSLGEVTNGLPEAEARRAFAVFSGVSAQIAQITVVHRIKSILAD